MLFPAQAFAQFSCNGATDGLVVSPPPFFEGDTVRMEIGIGASTIQNGNFIEIPEWSYFVDCGTTDQWPNCTDQPSDVEYLGNIVTNCVNGAGDDIVWSAVNASEVVFTATNGPARLPALSQCTIQFDIRVNTLGPGLNSISGRQGFNSGVCDNDEPGGATGGITINVESCSIDLVKEVSVDGGTNWFDANSSTGPNLEFPPGDALYRLIVENTGTADFVEDIVINDAALGIAGATIPGLAAGAQVTVGSGDISQLNALGRCVSAGAIENTSEATGVCRSDTLVDDSDSDNAWVNCVPPPEIDILKEVSVDGGTTWFDANIPADFPPAVEFPHGAMYRVEVCNTGQVDLVNVTVDDPELGIAGFVVGALAVGECRLLTAGDIPALTVAERCDAPGTFTNVAFANGDSAETGTPADEVSDPANMVCERPPGDAICRTPGFWGARGGDDGDASYKHGRNITLETIGLGTGLEICGNLITNTDLGSSASAIEAICISKGDPMAKYIRMATSAALNCELADCGGISDLLVQCNADCIAGDEDAMNACAGELGCFNEGGVYVEGECHFAGTCHPIGSDGVGGSGQICSFDSDKQDADPNLACGISDEKCYRVETCHDRELCPDGVDGDFCFEPPGPASSPKKCNKARKTTPYIFDIPGWVN